MGREMGQSKMCDRKSQILLGAHMVRANLMAGMA